MEVNIVDCGFERRLLKYGEGLNSISSVIFRRDLFEGFQSKVELAKRADDFCSVLIVALRISYETVTQPGCLLLK